MDSHKEKVMTEHLIPLSTFPPQQQYAGGYRIAATKKEFPVLDGMAFYKLVLKPQGVREPHWHANADEMAYVVEGKVFVSLFATGNNKQTFIASEGDCFFVPSGSLHCIVNIGNSIATLAVQFSNDQPEDFGLSGTCGMFTDAVLGNTWGEQSAYFAEWKRSTNSSFIGILNEPLKIDNIIKYSSPYHLQLDTLTPYLENPAGAVRVARKDSWPILRRQALYHLLLTEVGMREPHWHPETAEMGFVLGGKGRMSVMSPSGSVDTYEMNPGDLYFIPKAYPHHIENLGPGDLAIAIFFDNPMPEDIGFSGSIKSFPTEALSATLMFPTNKIEGLPTYYEDLLIVNRINPLD
jgi:oxalate decarboxylase